MPVTFNDSILETVKKGLNIPVDATAFTELIDQINSVLASIVHMGIGLDDGFEITGSTETWKDFLGHQDKRYALIRSLVVEKVRKMFDPSENSTVMKSRDEVINELTTRLYLISENDPYMDKETSPYSKLTKLSDYLYSMEYEKLDYIKGKKYMDEHYKPVPAGCSSVKSGNYFGRNLDWYYNWEISTIIKTKRNGKYFATLGVSSCVPELTKQTAEKFSDKEILECLPFTIVDGINECGVFVSTHVVYDEKGNTTGTIPTGTKKDTICMTMLPRYILDNYSSASQAISDIIAHVSVYANKQLSDLGMEGHFMIGDMNNCYVMEFVNNEIVIIQSNALTNFFLANVTLNSDGSVYTPELSDSEHKPSIVNNIQNLGMGLERWNIINCNISEVNNKSTMVHLMKDLLNYNKSYTNTENKWYTEFVGENLHGTLNVDSDINDFDYIIQISKSMYNYRNRSQDKDGVWHTTHTCVYDILNKDLYIFDSSEDGIEHHISLFE